MFSANSLPSYVSLTTPRIILSKENALVDDPISIQIEGLSPFQEVELVAKSIDAENELWVAKASFKADRNGFLFLDGEAPLTGNYQGVDGMGLFWSMSPASGKHISYAFSSKSIEVTFHLLVNGEEIASATTWRSWSLSEMRKILVREEGIIGTLFIPTTPEPPPVVITLNGSAPGVNESRAELLAAHGFAVFTLGYFGMEGLPSTLEYVPIEYFEKAFAWIKKRTDLDGSRMAILGGSKGGELVLLLGTLFPGSMQAIVAIVPDCSIFPGCAEDDPKPAWTYQGSVYKPVAFMAPVEKEKGLVPEDPIWLTPYFFKGIEEKPKLFEKARIPVEKIRCPILLVSASDDQMWPSAFFSEQVISRCEKSGVSCKHLNYPKAGHQMTIPFLPAPSLISWHPVTKRWYYMGGTAKDNEMAKRDYWFKTIQFLNQQLMPK